VEIFEAMAGVATASNIRETDNPKRYRLVEGMMDNYGVSGDALWFTGVTGTVQHPAAGTTVSTDLIGYLLVNPV